MRHLSGLLFVFAAFLCASSVQAQVAVQGPVAEDVFFVPGGLYPEDGTHPDGSCERWTVPFDASLQVQDPVTLAWGPAANVSHVYMVGGANGVRGYDIGGVTKVCVPRVGGPRKFSFQAVVPNVNGGISLLKARYYWQGGSGYGYTLPAYGSVNYPYYFGTYSSQAALTASYTDVAQIAARNAAINTAKLNSNDQVLNAKLDELLKRTEAPAPAAAPTGTAPVPAATPTATPSATAPAPAVPAAPAPGQAFPAPAAPAPAVPAPANPGNVFGSGS